MTNKCDIFTGNGEETRPLENPLSGTSVTVVTTPYGTLYVKNFGQIAGVKREKKNDEMRRAELTNRGGGGERGKRHMRHNP